jgi:hypothetical protein
MSDALNDGIASATPRAHQKQVSGDEILFALPVIKMPPRARSACDFEGVRASRQLPKVLDSRS